MTSNSKEVDEALVRIEEHEERSAERNIQSANDTESSLSSQLMLISTVFLTISVAVISGSDLLQNMNTLERGLLFLVFLFIVISVTCGVVYYIKCKDFYQKWGKLHFSNYEAFRDGNLGLKEPDIKKMNEQVRSISEVLDGKWLYAQLVFLGLGIFLSLVFLSLVLFSPQPHKEEAPNAKHHQKSFQDFIR